MSEKGEFSFSACVTWSQGRTGQLETRGLPSLEVSPPPEFHGREGAWTRERLRVAALVSSYMTAFVLIAEASKLAFKSLTIESEGRLANVEGSGYRVTEVLLRPTVVVSHSKDVDRTTRMLEKAEKKCLIASSVKSKVRIEPRVYHEQVPAYPCPPLSNSA